MRREAEFRRLYDAHRVAVHAYFLGRTADRSAAADLLQEVFLRVWQRLDEVLALQAESRRAWIFAVARNLSIDAHRRARTRADTATALRRQPADAVPAAEDAVLAADRLAAVTEAVARLPEPQRTALALSTAGGLSSNEIGVALGVPAGTVRYRLSLARRTLAATLSGYDDPATPLEER